MINDKEEKLFIKLMPLKEGPRVFIENFPLDKIEIRAYDELMPKLQNFEQKNLGTTKLRNMLCKCYGGKYSMQKESRGFYLILEDISETFKMPNLNEGIIIQAHLLLNIYTVMTPIITPQLWEVTTVTFFKKESKF